MVAPHHAHLPALGHGSHGGGWGEVGKGRGPGECGGRAVFVDRGAGDPLSSPDPHHNRPPAPPPNFLMPTASSPSSPSPPLLLPQINSYALHSLGPQVESLSGAPRFLTVYFASAFVGTVASVAFTPQPSLGASGRGEEPEQCGGVWGTRALRVCRLASPTLSLPSPGSQPADAPPPLPSLQVLYLAWVLLWVCSTGVTGRHSAGRPATPCCARWGAGVEGQ